MSDELPDGWARAPLPEIAQIIMGQSPPGSTYNDIGEGLPFFQGKADFGDLNPTVRKWCSAPGKIADPGDVLISIRAPVGPTNLADQVCAIGRGLSAIRPLAGIPSKYLLYAIRLQEAELAEQGTGSTFTAINRDHLNNIELAVPPLAEQQRIVAKVEALLARVNAARQRLGKVPAVLKRFRQSVLAAACSGRLTADWRQQNARVPPMNGIGERAEALRRERWEKVHLDRFRSRAETPKSDKWKSNYAPPDFDALPDLPELPDNWDWVRLGLLGQNPLETVQTGPFGAQLHNDEFVPEGVPVIAVGNLTGMGFGTQGLYFITSKKATQLDRYDVQGGDVLFARSGATLGKVCVAPSYVKDWRMTGHILRARVNRHLALPELVVYALHGDPNVRRQVSDGVRGITRPGFNTSLLESIAIPLAPLPEQHEIVRRVEALFRLADAIEKRVAAGAARADKLTQAILAKAFKGELVPTEAELARREGRAYEPASALLARIKASANPMAPVATGSKSRRRRSEART
jgi:type I restriction enzyme S subunit